MKRFAEWMSTYGPVFIAPVGFVFIIAGIASRVCDPIVGGLVLSSLLSLGDAIAYTILAWSLRDSGHGKPYRFIAGANWTTTAVLLLLLLSSLGVWAPIPTMMQIDNGLSVRSHERSHAIESLGRSRSRNPIDLKGGDPLGGDGGIGNQHDPTVPPLEAVVP